MQPARRRVLSLGAMTLPTKVLPVTSPDDPRLRGMGSEDVAGADQIAQVLALSPRERLQYLLDMLAFEERAHSARRLPPEP